MSRRGSEALARQVTDDVPQYEHALTTSDPVEPKAFVRAFVKELLRDPKEVAFKMSWRASK